MASQESEPQEERKFMKVKTLMERWDLKKSTAYDLVSNLEASGDIRVIRLKGKHIRITVSSVEEYENRQLSG